MSVEIIPAIIAKNFDELREMVEKVRPHVKWVHVDVMDGNFVPNFTWNKPEELKHYDPGVFIEAHLMILEPEKHAEEWIDAGVKRIIFHIEATSDPQGVIKICRKGNVGVGVAINPETPIENIESMSEFNSSRMVGVKLQPSLDAVLVLGVTPGFGGQEFKPEVLPKIKALRQSYPYLTIEVDGGMNPETARKAVEAGANIIVAGNYIFGSENTENAIEELRKAVNFT